MVKKEIVSNLEDLNKQQKQKNTREQTQGPSPI